MSEEFYWIDPATYKWWLDSVNYHALRNFDSNVLPQPKPIREVSRRRFLGI
ncbi:MAG: hypothetical protein QW756_06835 [Nitrososphaerota archaeon]